MLTLAQGWLLPFDDILLLGSGGIVAPSSLQAAVVAGPQVNLTWLNVGITSEDHTSIQRRDVTAGGSFAEVHTVGPDVASWTGDAGPFTLDHRYEYRVVVSGGPSDGQVSNTVSVRPNRSPSAASSTSVALRLALRLGF